LKILTNAYVPQGCIPTLVPGSGLIGRNSPEADNESNKKEKMAINVGISKVK